MTTRTRQAGFALVYLALILPLIGASLTGFLWYQSQQLRYSLGRAQMHALQNLNSAVTSYRMVQGPTILAGGSVTGVANSMAPTVPELVSLGYLDSGFKPSNLFGGGYKVSLSKVPAGCSGSSCYLSTLVALDSPVKAESGALDYAVLGEALKEGGPDAAYSGQNNSGVLSGNQGQWTATNPLGSVAGVLAVRGGYGSTGLGYLVRRDGSQGMSGSLDVGGNNLTNANSANASTANASGLTAQTASATGTVTTAKAVLPSGGSVQVGGSTVKESGGLLSFIQNGVLSLLSPGGSGTPLSAGTVQSQGSITASGNVSGQQVQATGTVQTQGNAQVAGTVAASGSLHGGYVTAGAACSTIGTLSHSNADGTTMLCRNGIWVPQKGCVNRSDFQLTACPPGQVGGVLWKRTYQCANATDAGSWSAWTQQSATCTSQSGAGWSMGLTNLNWGAAGDAVIRAVQMKNYSAGSYVCNLAWYFTFTWRGTACYMGSPNYASQSGIYTVNYNQITWVDGTMAFNTDPGGKIALNKVYSGTVVIDGCTAYQMNFNYYWNGSSWVISYVSPPWIIGYDSSTMCTGGS